ncbi:MAG: RsmE family RNA methyltransferase [Bacteroidota bacterium]
MQIFLLERLNSQTGWLGATETKHCIKVLRHQLGDEIMCIDGKGQAYKSRIKQYNKEETELQILEVLPAWGEHELNIRLAVSPLRLKDRFEFLIEKAVELGVSEIFPITCKRTDKYQSKFKPARLETQILAATKQTKRSRVATLHPLQSIEDFLANTPKGQNYVAYCEGEPIPLQQEADSIRAANTVSIMIGPEGDFTEEEIRFAERQNFTNVSLGENRLRTETAAVYALSIIKMLRGY